MNKLYDFVIVGAGIYGSTVARCLTDCGKSVLVIDKRNHIAGNCYTEKLEDSNIDIHVYGPHIFHTSNEDVWKFVNKYSKFNSFINRVKSIVDYKIYSMPFNMMTFNQIWGVITPKEAMSKIKEDIVYNDNDSFEGLALRTVGKTIYELLLKGYTDIQQNNGTKIQKIYHLTF